MPLDPLAPENWKPIDFKQMPIAAFKHLSRAIKLGRIPDEDLDAFAAWIKTNPTAPPVTWYKALGPLGHAYVVGEGIVPTNFLEGNMTPVGVVKLSMQSNEALKDLLLPSYGGRTGPEKEKHLSPDISVFICPYGSYRFVKHVDGEPVAALQVMKDREDGKKGSIANAYTLPAYRRQGVASELLKYAEKMFPKGVTHSTDLSGDGEGFANKTAAPRITAFHGTSVKHLRSILSQGLIPDVKEKAWNDDPDANMNKPSRESYGGIYLSTNLSTAKNAVRDQNDTGAVLLICVEVQPNTLYLDEDTINPILNQPLQHISDSSYHAIKYYLMATLPGGPQKYKADLDDVQDKYFEACFERWNYDLEKRTGKPMDSGLQSRLLKLLPDMWLAAVTRLAAHGAAQKNTLRSFGSIYGEIAPNYQRGDDVPEAKDVIPSPAEGERIFREQSEKITRALRLMARPERGSMWNTARVTEPIGYSGSNRITAVLEIRDSRKYRGEDWLKPVPIIVHYGQPPEEFWKQWEARGSSKYELTYAGQEKVEERKAASKQAAAVRSITLQEAIDRNMFGPVYHGTHEEARKTIDAEGFKVFEKLPGEDGKAHGIGSNESPIDFLGFGTYFACTKSIAKMFNGNSVKGLIPYYIDAPRLETINFASANNMKKWWVANGFDEELSKTDRVAATRKMTDVLKSKFDAVWFKGKGIHKLLDGEQICVFDPDNIYKIDNTNAKPGDIGCTVIRKADGMKGTLLGSRQISQEVADKFWGGNPTIYEVEWKKGGRDGNVKPADIEFQGAKQSHWLLQPKRADAKLMSGLPTVCHGFHGTSQEFDRFDTSMLGRVSDSSDSYAGFWFSKLPYRAMSAARDSCVVKYDSSEFPVTDMTVLECEIRMKNPLVWRPRITDVERSTKIIEDAKAKGRDGVIFVNGEGGENYVVWNSGQITIKEAYHPRQLMTDCGPASEPYTKWPHMAMQDPVQSPAQKPSARSSE